MRFNYGFRTDVGRKRQQNQDSGAAFPELGLFVVADGMGGHLGGEIASSMVVEHLPLTLRKSREQAEWDAKVAIREAIESANQEVYQRSTQDSRLHGMGTTTTALLFDPEEQTLAIGHVGDSRCYYIRPSAIWQLTRDHSLVQEKLRAGLISRAQLKTDRMKNVITRSVGFEERVQVEVYEAAAQPGDIYLICSDGLSGLLDEEEILAVIEKNLIQEGDVAKTVENLIASANANGGDDNITAIVVQVLEENHG